MALPHTETTLRKRESTELFVWGLVFFLLLLFSPFHCLPALKHTSSNEVGITLWLFQSSNCETTPFLIYPSLQARLDCDRPSSTFGS